MWNQVLGALRHYTETGRLHPYVSPWDTKKINEKTAAQAGLLLFSAMDFIGKKYGQEALDAYRGQLVKTVASGYSTTDIQNPLHFANLMAQEMRNLYGDQVEVRGNANRAVLDRRSSRVYEQSCRLDLVGDYASFCKNCSEFHMAIAKELGFHGEGKVTAAGYQLTIHR
jgi:hypothetical protein